MSKQNSPSFSFFPSGSAYLSHDLPFLFTLHFFFELHSRIHHSHRHYHNQRVHCQTEISTPVSTSLAPGKTPHKHNTSVQKGRFCFEWGVSSLSLSLSPPSFFSFRLIIYQDDAFRSSFLSLFLPFLTSPTLSASHTCSAR